MDDVKDQVQEDSQAPTEAPQGPKVLTKEKPVQATKEQSATTGDVAVKEEEAKPPVFQDHLGRELTAEQLHQEYLKTQGYVTKLEKERLAWEKSAQEDAKKAVSENDYLKNVDPNVREAIVQIVTPVIQDSIRQRDAEAQRRAQDEAFTKRLDELENKYKGGNGLPKFDRVKVLAAMQDPSNGIYDPEWKFKEMHWAAIIDYENKQAMKGKARDTETEPTGGAQPRKPESGKTPRTWDEAAKATYERLTNQ